MLTLYDNPFSPFARKVRMVLRFKGLEYRPLDALALDEHDRLVAVNPRAEVPVLVDGAVTVSDSADIVSYLEDRFPEPSVLPIRPEQRAKARRWQRVADTVLDSIIHDISIWTWPTHRRTDQPPEGLLDAGRRELHEILMDLEGSFDVARLSIRKHDRRRIFFVRRLFDWRSQPPHDLVRHTLHSIPAQGGSR